MISHQRQFQQRSILISILRAEKWNDPWTKSKMGFIVVSVTSWRVTVITFTIFIENRKQLDVLAPIAFLSFRYKVYFFLHNDFNIIYSWECNAFSKCKCLMIIKMSDIVIVGDRSILAHLVRVPSSFNQVIFYLMSDDFEPRKNFSNSFC